MMASFSAAAQDSISLCQAKIQTQNLEVKIAQDRFRVGEVTRTDVNFAVLNALNMRFDCRDILFAEYCQDAIPLVDKVAIGVAEEIKYSLRPHGDLHMIRTEQARITAICN